MTRHRKKEEWIADILEAAADEMASSGYANLTMEAVAGRTGLSKGGVYRFFANKREVALALYTQCYAKALDFDIDEAVGFGLPIADTVFKLIFGQFASSQELARYQSVWVQLAPEALRDEGFRAERSRMLALLLRKFGELVRRLIARDGLILAPGFEDKLDATLLIGVALIEGLIFQGSTGTSVDRQAELIRRFVDLFIAQALWSAA